SSAMALGERIPTQLRGRRVVLRPLTAADFEAWREVRQRNRGWLLKWEPKPPPGAPDDTESRPAFVARCGAREREWQMGCGEGIAHRYLAINGVWEDHIRYALTSEDWHTRRDELLAAWVGETTRPPVHLRPRG